MTVDIGEIEVVGLKHAILRSMAVLNNRLRDGLDTCHPDRRNLDWYKNFEDELDMLKTFKVFLDKLDALQQEGVAE